MEDIRELRESFTRKGRLFTQIDRTDLGYVYEVSVDGDIQCYESFRRIIKKGHYLSKDKRREVRYPCDEDFGSTAACYIDKELALKWLYELKPRRPDSRGRKY